MKLCLWLTGTIRAVEAKYYLGYGYFLHVLNTCTVSASAVSDCLIELSDVPTPFIDWHISSVGIFSTSLILLEAFVFPGNDLVLGCWYASKSICPC